jgi:hypothetical protein
VGGVSAAHPPGNHSAWNVMMPPQHAKELGELSEIQLAMPPAQAAALEHGEEGKRRNRSGDGKHVAGAPEHEPPTRRQDTNPGAIRTMKSPDHRKSDRTSRTLDKSGRNADNTQRSQGDNMDNTTRSTTKERVGQLVERVGKAVKLFNHPKDPRRDGPTVLHTLLYPCLLFIFNNPHVSMHAHTIGAAKAQ